MRRIISKFRGMFGSIFGASAIVVLLFGLCVPFAASQTFSRPAPTASDWTAVAKLPDFTGVWELLPTGGGRFTNPAIGVPAAGDPAVLTPEYAAKKKALEGNAPGDNASANCLPPGMPGIMAQPYPLEFLLTPGQVTIVIEAYQQVRHVYTDGRPLPKDPDPSFMGTSIGHWDGDTLVVDSVGFSTETEIEPQIPHSDKMRINERFHLMGPDTMVIDTTITDPEALAAPYKRERLLKRHRNWAISEYECEQNNRNFVDSSGKVGVDLSNPGGAAAKDK